MTSKQQIESRVRREIYQERLIELIAGTVAMLIWRAIRKSRNAAK